MTNPLLTDRNFIHAALAYAWRTIVHSVVWFLSFFLLGKQTDALLRTALRREGAKLRMLKREVERREAMEAAEAPPEEEVEKTNTLRIHRDKIQRHLVEVKSTDRKVSA